MSDGVENITEKEIVERNKREGGLAYGKKYSEDYVQRDIGANYVDKLLNKRIKESIEEGVKTLTAEQVNKLNKSKNTYKGSNTLWNIVDEQAAFEEMFRSATQNDYSQYDSGSNLGAGGDME